ncbi:MAG: lipoyl(octanoyl) transferase LipB [Gammaproteobacteria bacterium]|nr:lipoyl(octanoyl) transferase LipB [Gammaproteobacteria bacterium]
MTVPAAALAVRRLGVVDYAAAAFAMRAFTAARGPSTVDEVWLLQHPAVYTGGLRCRTAIGGRGDINGVPLVASDRGGLFTWHGPGQIVAYLLLDLRRAGLGVRQLVRGLEQAVIACIKGYGVTAGRMDGAPGVYVGGAKIAALGLRVRRQCTTHGLSFNVHIDKRAFAAIDPCGVRGLEVTDLCTVAGDGCSVDIAEVEERLLKHLAAVFGYGDLRPGNALPQLSAVQQRAECGEPRRRADVHPPAAV